MKDWKQTLTTISSIVVIIVMLEFRACDEINRRFDQVEVRLDRIEQKLDNHISDYTVHNIKQSNPE